MRWLQRKTEEHQRGHQPRDSRRERAGVQGEAEVPQGVEEARERGWQQSCLMPSLKDTQEQEAVL